MLWEDRALGCNVLLQSRVSLVHQLQAELQSITTLLEAPTCAPNLVE